MESIVSTWEEIKKTKKLHCGKEWFLFFYPESNQQELCKTALIVCECNADQSRTIQSVTKCN